MPSTTTPILPEPIATIAHYGLYSSTKEVLEEPLEQASEALRRTSWSDDRALSVPSRAMPHVYPRTQLHPEPEQKLCK